MRNVKSVAFIIATAALLAACKTPAPATETPVVERPVETPQPVALFGLAPLVTM